MQLSIFKRLPPQTLMGYSTLSFDLTILNTVSLELVGLNGLEPSTSRLSGVCSNQLSYNPILSAKLFLYATGGDKRIRTVDPLLARQVL